MAGCRAVQAAGLYGMLWCLALQKGCKRHVVEGCATAASCRAVCLVLDAAGLPRVLLFYVDSTLEEAEQLQLASWLTACSAHVCCLLVRTWPTALVILC
jgi:hypothetical protein